MKEPIARKEYYSIGEACAVTGLKPHVLRYWESNFAILRPKKNRAGKRTYRPKDVELILLVKHLLYDQKYTIEGANQKLREIRGEGRPAHMRTSLLDSEFLGGMKAELHDLRVLLTRSEDEGREG